MHNPHQPQNGRQTMNADVDSKQSEGLTLAPPAFSLTTSSVAQRKPDGNGPGGDFDFENATNEARADHLAQYALTNVAYVSAKLRSIQSNYAWTYSSSDDVSHLLVQKLKENGLIALISPELKALLKGHLDDGWVDSDHKSDLQTLEKDNFADYLPKKMVEIALACKDAEADKLIQGAFTLVIDNVSCINVGALYAQLSTIGTYKTIFEKKLGKALDIAQIQSYYLARLRSQKLPAYDPTSKSKHADAASALVLLLAHQALKTATDSQVDMWASYLNGDKDHEKERREVKEEARERKSQSLLSHSVKIKGSGIEVKIGDITASVDLATMRQALVNNFNWTGVINVMKFIGSQYLDAPYKVSTDLAGNSSDREKIMPSKSLLFLVKLQVEKQIEKYKSTASAKAADIAKAITADVKPDFIMRAMGIKDMGLLMSNRPTDGKQKEMPDFKNADEITLYKSLRGLVLERNGLWSDKEKVTNIVSVRRSLDASAPKYNDMMFVAWVVDGKQHVKRYDATTEPGNLTHGMLAEQTTTMNPGYHSTSGKNDPGGRTKSIYAKANGGTNYKFTGGNETNRGMNFHFGNVDGEERLPAGLYSSTPDKTKELSESEFAAHHALTEAIYILQQYQNSSNLTCYEYLNQCKTNEALSKEKREKAASDLQHLEELFVSFENYENFKSVNSKQGGQNNPLVNALKTKKYTDVADNTEKSVGSWSEGCQVIGSGQDFYDFWHHTTEYAQETKQTTWYYTIVNIDTLKTTTKAGTIKGK